MQIINNKEYKSNLYLDMYLPDTKGYSTVVYFHGGGLTGGSKEDPQYVEIAKDFVKAGYAFISCNYSMYPNAKFPDYLYDAAVAIKYIKDNIKGYNANGNIFVSGQSAGAWMAAMLMLDDKYLRSVGIDPLDITGWIVESGQMTSHFNVIEIESKLNPLTQRIDERAPIYFVNENTKFTKAIFFYYDNDMPMRKLQNLLLEETIRRFNPKADIETKELPGTHCYGSSFREDGEYRYVKESLLWLKKKGF